MLKTESHNTSGQIHKMKVGVFIIHHNKLLLIREKSGFDGNYYWNIVKGTFDSERDNNFTETAQRETQEEVGATLSDLKLFNVFEVEKNKVSIIQINFSATPRNRVEQFTREPSIENIDEDIIEARFFAKLDLKKLKRSDLMNERAHLTIQDWIMDRKPVFRILT